MKMLLIIKWKDKSVFECTFTNTETNSEFLIVKNLNLKPAMDYIKSVYTPYGKTKR